MAVEQIVNLKVTDNVEQTTKNVTSLKTELRKAQQEVAQLSEKFGATSKEAVEAAKRAAELKDKIGDAKALTDAFNPDAKFKALTASLSGVAGGFAAYQGALGLAGADTKDFEKTLLKVQSAMALSQGLQALGESRDSFKQLKAVAINAFQGIKSAIGSTGIGLLIVALGTLYANWDSIKKAVTDTFPAFKDIGSLFNKTKEIVFGVGSAIIQYLITPFKVIGKLISGDFKGALNDIKNGFNFIGNYEKGAMKERQDQADAAAKERLEKQIKNKENEIAVQKALGKDTYLLEKDNLHRKLLLNKDNQDELDKLRQEERILDATHKKTLSDKEKAHLAELKKQRDEAYRKQQEELIARLKAETDLKNQAALEQEKNDTAFFDAEEQARQNNLRAGMTAQEAELDAINAKYQAQLDYAKQHNLDATNLENEKLNAINDVNLKYQAIDYENKKKASEDEIALNNAVKEAKVNIAKNTLDLIAEVAGRGSKIGKAVALTQATINGIEGVQAAYTTAQKSPITIGFPAYPYVQAGLAGVFSALQIQKILSTNVGSSSAPSSSAGASGGGASTPPSFNIVGQNSNNQLAQTIANKQQQPVQAFVVSGNISTAQSLDRNKIDTSTFN